MEVSSNDDGVKSLKRRLSENMDHRTGNFEAIEVYSLATLLDCRYKDKYFVKEENKVKAVKLLKRRLELEVEKFPDDSVVEVESSGVNNSSSEDNNNRSNTLAEMFAQVKKVSNQNVNKEKSDDVDSVVDAYLNSKLEDNNLSWWRGFYERSEGNRVKLALCSLARKYLTVPPTSTETERLFSSAGNIVERRNRLLPENIEKLVVLRDNMIMQNITVDW